MVYTHTKKKGNVYLETGCSVESLLMLGSSRRHPQWWLLGRGSMHGATVQVANASTPPSMAG
jgi:hypothetical protein